MRIKGLVAAVGLIVFAPAHIAGARFDFTAESSPPSLQDPRDEWLFHRNGVPLSRLIKDPKARGPIVIVHKDTLGGAGLVGPGAGMRQLEWIASLGKIGVLVARVEEVISQLRAPDQDWIMSNVRATITTVIQQPGNESFVVGQSVEFQQDGGDLTIDGRRVHAVVDYADPHGAGNRYLLFIRRNGPESHVTGLPGQLHVYEPTSYLIDANARLQSLCKGVGCQWAHAENGVELTEAIRRLSSRTP